MSLTDVTLCGKTLCSPVIAASGTFGFGGEYAGIVDMKKLGGISGKGLTLEGKYGNEGERLWETPDKGRCKRAVAGQPDTACRRGLRRHVECNRSAESRRAAFH